MRLINSIMSQEEISNDDIKIIKKIISSKFTNALEVQKYKYEDRKYFETDFDLINVSFEKNRIYEEINKLIMVYEEIFKLISINIEIIVANDDTETEILKYENDWTDIGSFGLFITTRDIPNIQPYYSSNICNVYLNFEYVSFGIMF